MEVFTSLLTVTGLEEGHLNPTYFALFVISLLAFLIKTLRSKHPFLDIRVLKIPTVWLDLLPFFIYQFSNLSANFILPNYLIQFTDANSTQAGFALLPGTLLSALLAPLFGRFNNTKGPKLSLYIGNTLFTIAIALLALLTNSYSVFLVASIYIIFTFGRNMAFNYTLAISVSTLPDKKKADVSAIFQMMQQFAGALGTAVASVLANASDTLSIGVQNIFTPQLVLVLAIYPLFFSLFKKSKQNHHSSKGIYNKFPFILCITSLKESD